jgi:acyl transferase domain-containing protein
VEWAVDPDVDETLLARTSVAQPLLVACEVALARRLAAWGARPDAVLGHSVGELAAAVVSGALSPVEAVRFAAERGAAMQSLCPPGAMAAVVGDPATVERVVEAADGELSLAAVNGPRHVVVSGTGAAVDAAVAVLEQHGCRSRRLAVSRAFHSDLMTPALEAVAAAAEPLRPASHRVPFLSTVTGGWGPRLDASYLTRHARGTVEFGAGVRRLLDDGYDTFVEVGPGAALGGLVTATARARTRDADVAVMSPLDGDAEDDRALLRTVGRLWVRGVAVTRAPEATARRRVDVPTYPYQRRRHWLPGTGAPAATRPAAGLHVSPLLHRHTWDDRPLPAGEVLRSLCVVAPASGRDELPDRLADHLAARGTVVHRRSVEHLDGLPPCSAVVVVVGRSVDLEGPGSLEEAARSATTALLAVARHLGDRPAPLVVVTEDVAVTGAGPERARPAQSLAAGLAAALADEDPRQAVRVVDLCSLDDPAERLTAVVREVDARPSPGPAEHVAWRRGSPAGEDAAVGGGAASRADRRAPADGCYLVTGGAGGVGGQLARALAARGAPDIVLVGRSSSCPPALLRQLADAGASARYVGADLASEADVEALVAGLPALDGVFHAAGVVAPGRLRSASQPEVEQVLAPKVRGTFLLARALAAGRRRPDTFVLVSSIASAVPGYAGGLGAYAAANAFLDAFADAESQAGRPCRRCSSRRGRAPG